MGSTPVLQLFSTRAAASQAAADLLTASLRSDLDRRGQASLVVSGGTTPGDCFEFLSREPLDWSAVVVVPSDERWLPPDHADSNEHLIRSRLLQHAAAKARLLPLFRQGLDIQAAPAAIEADLDSLPPTFSAALLGMGADGHFASLFPDISGLHDALDPANPTRCVAVRTAGSPYPRISLTLPALLNSRQIVLLLFGAEKRAVFEDAWTGAGDYPVARLFAHAGSALTACWAP